MTDAVVTVQDLDILIRRPRPTDQGYIASTWVHSIGRGTANPKEPGHRRTSLNITVDRMLDDQAVRLLIAAEPTRTDIILGWMAYTPMPGSRIVHYVYTREKMRRRGIAGELVRKAFPLHGAAKLVYTMRGPDHDSLALKYRDAIHMTVREFLGDQA